MGQRLDPEKIERLVYEIQHSPIQRIAVELSLGRELTSACRRGYIPLAVQRVLLKIPKLTDKNAWLKLAGLAPAEDEPITDTMREGFE